MKQTFTALLHSASSERSNFYNLTYLLFRVYCGISISIGAGLSKVFHKINPDGGEDWSNLAFGVPDWFVKQVGEIGFTFISPSFWASLAVYGEFIGGLFIALGLFTRISALQMAFQFFVVSFIWYDEPMPFAMYYQQLIFWTFVLIVAQGGGRFSLDHWLMGRTWGAKKRSIAPLFLLLAVNSFGQSDQRNERVSFTISNPSLQMIAADIRYFSYAAFAPRGYGYDLGALGTHAVNMPVGTRVYRLRKTGRELLFVVTQADQGRSFDLTKKYEIGLEEQRQAEDDEKNEAIARAQQTSEKPDMATLAKAFGLEMVRFRVGGKTIFSQQTRVRAQLPFDPEKSNNGFSHRLSQTIELEVAFPVGTKIYLCDGDFWSGDVNETLLFTVTPQMANTLVRL